MIVNSPRSQTGTLSQTHSLLWSVTYCMAGLKLTCSWQSWTLLWSNQIEEDECASKNLDIFLLHLITVSSVLRFILIGRTISAFLSGIAKTNPHCRHGGDKLNVDFFSKQTLKLENSHHSSTCTWTCIRIVMKSYFILRRRPNGYLRQLCSRSNIF